MSDSTLTRRISEFAGVALFAMALIWLIALVLNIAAVATLVILTIRTRGFTQATRVENWVSVGPVAAASGDALAVSLIVALVILSIIIWLVIVAFCVAAVIGLVVILANSQSSS